MKATDPMAFDCVEKHNQTGEKKAGAQPPPSLIP
jgi:hypothetical protein